LYPSDVRLQLKNITYLGNYKSCGFLAECNSNVTALPYVHFWSYPLDITPVPGIKTIQPMIALYAEWMKMNAVVLNVNYALTVVSTGMNADGFLVSHS
jgi:hypothetical protein